MRIDPCNFCSCKVYPGHGITFVRNDCKVFKFCRAKCHRAFKKKRNPRTVRWTKAYRMTHGKELTNDLSQKIEKKASVTAKYSKENWSKAVSIMKRVDEIRQRRQDQFIKNRLLKGRRDRKRADIREVEHHINLILHPKATKIRSDIKEVLSTGRVQFKDNAFNELAENVIAKGEDQFEVYEEPMLNESILHEDDHIMEVEEEPIAN
ncbi:hypothetical protein GJ496_003397 [Pomphorhynchus laevis]|nr:hypothetical protein GJ496_003397 [Pomphorhynchus laevis]